MSSQNGSTPRSLRARLADLISNTGGWIRVPAPRSRPLDRPNPDNRPPLGPDRRRAAAHPTEARTAQPPAEDGPIFTDLRGVLKEERKAIARRRKYAYGRDFSAEAVAKDAVGLALSGGGLRSATFNLGLIQALHATGLFRHVDYLITISGGGYTGCNLALHAAKASEASCTTATAATPAEKAAPNRPEADWFPYPIGQGGRQNSRLVDFYKRGDYLDRPAQLGFVWLSGTVLNLIMLLSGLAALSAAAAFLFRVFDFVPVDLTFQWLAGQFLLRVHTIGATLDQLAAQYLPRATWLAAWHVPGLVLALAVSQVPRLVRHLCRKPEGGDLAPRGQFAPRRACRRISRMLYWPVTFFAFGCWGTLWLGWPTHDNAGKAWESIRGTGQDASSNPAGDEESWDLLATLPIYYFDYSVTPAHLSARWDEAQTLADLFLDLHSGDEDRERSALKLVRSRASSGKRDARSVKTSDEPDINALSGRELTDLAEKTAREVAVEFRAAHRQWDRSPARDPHRAVAGPDGLYHLYEMQRVRQLTWLAITDLFRALVPAMLCTLAYAFWRMYQRAVDREQRRPGDLCWKLQRLCWVMLGLGLVVALVNGDTDIGFLKYLLPHVPGFGVVEEETGVISGARITLTGTLSTIRSLMFTIPTMIAASLALVPLVSRNKFLESAELPKDTARGKFARVVITSVVVILPLATFGFMARENVSGAAPLKESMTPKDRDGKAAVAGASSSPTKPTADGPAPAEVEKAGAEATQRREPPEPRIARMAYCPDSRFGSRNYLIDNDQIARFLILAASALTFGFLAWTVDLNRTSIHTFYRDRLYEAYLAEKPREQRKRYELSRVDGSAVGFPHHVIATTMNQFPGADELTDTTHAFIFSRLYCGSEASGYRRTDHYVGGVDLADAMAISGAAISPVQARSLVARLTMLILNMRLGQWYPNPNPALDPGRRTPPNLLLLLVDNLNPPGKALWKSMILEGWSRTVSDRCKALISRRRPSAVAAAPPGGGEPRAYCFLSDGAHFDNLGIGVLLHRRCRLMIVSDVSHDPELGCEELIAALRRARARHGVEFEPMWMSRVRELLGVSKSTIAPTPDPNYDPFRFRSTSASEASREKVAARFVRENFLVGKVHYPQDPQDPDANREGLLVLVKPSLTAELVDHPEILQYLQTNGEFPHDSDIEQVFDEARVEAYRQLGHCVGESLQKVLGDGPGSSREALLGIVDKLLSARAHEPEVGHVIASPNGEPAPTPGTRPPGPQVAPDAPSARGRSPKG